MRRDLETYRVAESGPVVQPVPLDPPRVQFLGPRQDAALGWRVAGGLFVCAVVLAAVAFLVI